MVRSSADASFFMVTLAFGTTAPAESATVPVSVPVNCCPKPSGASRRRTSNMAAALAVFIDFSDTISNLEIIDPPEFALLLSPNPTHLPRSQPAKERPPLGGQT